MMVDNKPVLAVLYVSESVWRGEYLCFSVLDVGKRIIAGINRRTAVNADQLIAERNFEAGKNPKGGHEIISQGRSIGTHRRRQRPPEHGVIGIELQYLVGFVFAKRSRPRRGTRGIVTSALIGVAGAFVGFHVAILLALGGGIATSAISGADCAAVGVFGWRMAK